MARKSYDPKSKAAIVEVVRSARNAGKSWKEAYEAAKAAGFAGSLLSVVQMNVESNEPARPMPGGGVSRPANVAMRAQAISLAEATRDEFDRDVLWRGEDYYRHGKVKIASGDATIVAASVRGGQRYDVMLELSKNVLDVNCTCPYFSTVGPCKHVWATILTADARGFVQPQPGVKHIEVVEADADDEFEDDDYESDTDDDDDIDVDEEDEEYDGDGEESESLERGRAPAASNIIKSYDFQKRQPIEPEWKQILSGLQQPQGDQRANRGAWPAGSQLLYVIDVPTTLAGRGLVLDLFSRQLKQNGEWGVSKPSNLIRSQVALLADPADRQIAALLLGGGTGYGQGGSFYSSYDPGISRFVLSPALQDVLLPQLCQTGRCQVRQWPSDEPRTLQLDDGAPWEFRVEVQRDEARKAYVLKGALWRDATRVDLAEPILLVAGGAGNGWVFWPERVARLNDFQAFEWIALLRKQKVIRAPMARSDELLELLFGCPHLPRLDLPEELRCEEVQGAPRPRLKLSANGQFGRDVLHGELSFDYDGAIVSSEKPGSGVFHAQQRRVVLRNAAAECVMAQRLEQVGFRPDRYRPETWLELRPALLPRVVQTLIAENWHVEAEGKLYRRAGDFKISVTSGIDWFELHGEVDFDGSKAQLPSLLAALKKGENVVRLDDGNFGMLPEDWLKKYGLLAGTGTPHDDHLRFTKTQAGLLDALLAAQPEVTCDATFNRMRQELRSFESVTPVQPPAGFVGELRGYQCDGLGWLNFLQRFGFGGCLADDMGLGKTIQVLALLESRRTARAQGGAASSRPGPTLAVVPRSLIFNWQQEAARFTPQLRVLDHTGHTRVKDSAAHFEDYDLILTTYGTLRRDIVHLKDVQFDYLVLDEAQAVKNANTGAAKAARLLKGQHRLCLSGTPIENHLGELWSLFEFLNPGMLGAASVFRMGTSGNQTPDSETRTLLSRALRPFILRRTKAQVATDLPEKTEQTLFCELDSAQRKLYDELRGHYREALLARVKRDGINKAKIQILEALLRLRQAACHPGLIDKKKIAEPSAKLEALLPQLGAVLEEGHKALVFSQFTSLLAIVRQRLDAQKISYEYLDGKTRDRETPVKRFQNEPDCKLFLISLKAGGLGLNLTAAEYVFLLDPWWNPAVEAQAIDRAHRIGQTRSVFAYRLIARDTVEEKVLELQKTKRDLADAILNADNSLIRSLKREDLELLLG